MKLTFFLHDYFFKDMSTLTYPKPMIGECSSECLIIFWRLFKNVNPKHEWIIYTHTICVVFCVLVLKVVTMYH
jgi:hypothetical protein